MVTRCLQILLVIVIQGRMIPLSTPTVVSAAVCIYQNSSASKVGGLAKGPLKPTISEGLCLLFSQLAFAFLPQRLGKINFAKISLVIPDLCEGGNTEKNWNLFFHIIHKPLLGLTLP